MTSNYTPPTLGSNPYLDNVTVTGYADGKEYSYRINRVLSDLRSTQDCEDVYSVWDAYPIRTISRGVQTSMTLNIIDPDWKLEIKEMKQVSIKHSMSMEVIGDVSTENITSFTSLLPANATWTAKVEKSPYGGKEKTIFTAVWDVEPITQPAPVEDEDDDDDDDYDSGCSCCA